MALCFGLTGVRSVPISDSECHAMYLLQVSSVNMCFACLVDS
jgi:hypothetical protein